MLATALLTGEFMREHVAANSRGANVRSLQYFQTWQIIVLIFSSFSINDRKENVESPLSEKEALSRRLILLAKIC